MTTSLGSADEMHVVHARAAGLDVHTMQITASVRVCQPGGGVQCSTRQFSALPAGLAALAQRLTSHRVTAATMEATGIFWKALGRPRGRRHRPAATACAGSSSR